MKKKATTRKVTVRNGRFMAAVKESVATRTGTHTRITQHGQSTGIIEKLVEANKKAAASR